MKISIKTLTLAAAVALLLPGISSCEDMIEEKAYTFVTTDDIENSDKGADMWTIGVYNALTTDLFIYNMLPRPLDYDCDYISGAVWQFAQFGSGNFQGGDGQTDALWNGMYSIINKANKAISNINALDKATPAHRRNCIGELYTIKAWAYFMLVRAYGDIPVHSVSVDESKNFDNNPRIPIKDVYEKTIIPLLDSARVMTYKNSDGGYRAGRVCAATAASLEAKVYATIGAASTAQDEEITVKTGNPYVLQNVNGNLTKVYTDPVKMTFKKDVVAGYGSFVAENCYQQAYTLSKDVMDGKYGNHELASYDELWSHNGRACSEFLFSLQSVSGDQSFGTLFSSAYSGRYNDAGHVDNSLTVGMRKHWYLLFEEKDYRVEKGVLHCWIRQNSDTSWGGGSYYPNFGKWRMMMEMRMPPFDNPEVTAGWRCDEGGSEQFFAFTTKYADVTDNTLERTDANYPFLRYADVVLINAEASNELNGPNTEALAALNSIRERSNATPHALSLFPDKASLRSAIIEERAMELAQEGDRRWDLIRWGIYLPAMNALGGMDEANNVKSRQEKHLLFPIPTLEVLTNKGITGNNPGWN